MVGSAARADELNATAEKVKESFNRRFWNDEAGCCFDVVDDDSIDTSIRPNQIFAVSLRYPVLDAKGEVSAAATAESDPITLAIPGLKPTAQ